MTRHFVFTLFLTLFLGISLATIATAQNAEIEALLDEIDTLESERDRLAKDKAKTETDLDSAKSDLRSIRDSMANVDAYITSAKAELAAADNEADRADWLAVIESLTRYRQELEYQYNSVAYTISLLNAEIERLNQSIADIERQITAAYARLAALLAN